MHICSVNQNSIPLSVSVIVGITLTVATIAFLIFSALNASGILHLLSKTQAHCSLIGFGIPTIAVIISIIIRTRHTESKVPSQQPLEIVASPQPPQVIAPLKLTLEEKKELLSGWNFEAIFTYIENNPEDPSFRHLGLMRFYAILSSSPIGTRLNQKCWQMGLLPDEAFEFGCALPSSEDLISFSRYHKIDASKVDWSLLRKNLLFRLKEENAACLGYALTRMNNSPLNPHFLQHLSHLNAQYNDLFVKAGKIFFSFPPGKEREVLVRSKVYKKICNVTALSKYSKILKGHILFYNLVGNSIYKYYKELVSNKCLDENEKLELSLLNEIFVEIQSYIYLHDYIPNQILKKLKLKNEKALAWDLPLSELTRFLNNIKSLENLGLLLELRGSTKTKEGHALLISLDPPLFCDANEDNFSTNQPRYRCYSNLDEMLTALSYHIELCYDYTKFSLISYEKI